MAEIEAAFKRIGNYRDVMGVVIIGKEREVIRTNVSPELSAEYGLQVPDLVHLASNMIRTMDPQNDLKFLRLKSTKCEIMVAPYPDFSIIVLQQPEKLPDE